MFPRVRARLQNLSGEWRAAYRKNPVALSIVVVVFAALISAALAGGFWIALTLRGASLPDESSIRRIGEMDQATAVFDDKDQLAFTIFKEQRIEVPLDQVSPNLIHAIVAIEDQHFYEHHGIDVPRIFSAIVADIRHGRAAQGGSTITQQLARQSFLTPDKTLRRKLQEAALAVRIERQYSK